MNDYLVTKTVYVVLCMASTILSYGVNTSGSPVNSARDRDVTKEPHSLRINISDARGKRHNLPLVEVENANLHRIATCTKVPGRLICKSGRYNYVINNGNFEFPAETLEKFVSALYQKAKDQKESDFAVALVAPEKETVAPSTLNLHLATVKPETTESVDQLQPVTIECELTDAKTLKETNPDYQPKPNERVFKCITKRLGLKKKRQHTLVISNGYSKTVRNSQSDDRKWKVFYPPWETPGNHHHRRSLSISATSYPRKQPRDVVKKSGFDAMMYRRPEMVEEGDENDKNVAGYYHNEFPRPRVRDYNYTCIDVQTVGWCPPLRSTECLPDVRLRSSTLHPVFYTESSQDRLRKYRHLRRLVFRSIKRTKIAYKIRNPLLDFIIPFGLHTEDRNGGSNRRDNSTEGRNEDEYQSATPNCPHFTGRRSGTIALPYEASSGFGCPIHDSEENPELGVSDDEGEGNKESERSDENGNPDNTNIRKTSSDETPMIEICNERTKNDKKGNKNCHHQKTTKKHPSKRKKISDCYPRPSKPFPDSKSAESNKKKLQPSPKSKSCRTTKQPKCNCQDQPEIDCLGGRPTPPAKRCSTVCTVISQRICIGKRRSITTPMIYSTFLQSEKGERWHSQ